MVSKFNTNHDKTNFPFSDFQAIIVLYGSTRDNSSILVEEPVDDEIEII